MVALNLPFITLIVFPPVAGWIAWKAWSEARQEIDARKALWLLRDEGVQLRSEGITVHGYAEWESRFNHWHRRTLRTAVRLDEELAYRLRPLNQWRSARRSIASSRSVRLISMRGFRSTMRTVPIRDGGVTARRRCKRSSTVCPWRRKRC